MNQNTPALPAVDKAFFQKKLKLTEVPANMVPAKISRECAPFDVETYGKGFHELYFLPEAAAEFDSCVQYGRKRASNIYEQQFVGLGHRFIDTDGKIITVVTRIISLCSPTRGPVHAKLVSEGNDSVLDILDNERKIQNQLEKQYNQDENGYRIDCFLKYGPSEVVLFGHTHPDLGCFFSPTDHRSSYSTPTTPIVTFVCDPIRRDMKAMVGVDGEDVKIMVCRHKAGAPAAAPQRASGSLRDDSVEKLWQRISAIANLILQKSGVNGNFDCHHDRRGVTHMQLHITYRPSTSRYGRH